MLLNLNLTGNKITDIPLLPYSLTCLYASRNRLFYNTLSTQLGALDRLIILDLSHNQLEYIFIIN